ncbi:hypothetical protein PMIN06_007242 [Paraphaeosphaeria minitans]
MLSQISGGTLYKVMPAFCGSAFMLYVYDAGVLGGIQSTVQFLDAIGNPNGVSIIPIIASIYNLAAAAMSLAVTLFGLQRRRKTILLGDCLSALVQLFKPRPTQLVRSSWAASSVAVALVASPAPCRIIWPRCLSKHENEALKSAGNKHC